jgi:hypothetical protein
MLNIASTHHAKTRIRQRGFCDADINMLLTYAENQHGDVYHLPPLAAQRGIAEKKREIAALERFSGSKVVISDGVLVTAYHGPNGKIGKKKVKGESYDH